MGLIAAWLAAPPAFAQQLTLARLDADPVPAQVLAGTFDPGFSVVPGWRIRERDPQPRWWRVTAVRDIARSNAPQLVLQMPQLNRVEAWTPGQAMPLRRALTGVDTDADVSTRALVVPLPDGLAAGESVYLRVQVLGTAPMPVSIEPLAQVHRADLRHVAGRWAVLSSLVVLAILALGSWIGSGKRGYAYLMLALLAYVGFSATAGGEVRMLPGLAWIAIEPRVVRLFGLLGLLASIVFVANFLELRTLQPRIMGALAGCAAVVALLLMANLASNAGWIGVMASLSVLFASLAAFTASVIGSLRRQRAAVFLLVSWLPMMALLWLQGGARLAWWSHPDWVGPAFPVAVVLSALVVMVGLGDSMRQLRRDRDRASALATFDELTGALTRQAVEAGLKTAVGQAHLSGRPLSLLFFDIDRFKRINDDYGHRVGDSYLRIIGLRTRNRLRTYDLFGRFGGDEVLVVLPNTRLGEALGVAENLRSAVNCRPLSIDGHMLEASLSIGVAELAAGESAEHLLERADEALYESKSAGRDRVTGHTSRETGSRKVASPATGSGDARSRGIGPQETDANERSASPNS